MIVKVSVLTFHPNMRDRWLENQYLWNRAKHRTVGFCGADILLRHNDPNEAVTYARWASRDVENGFMETAGKRCYVKSGVKDMLAAERWEYYNFDHGTKEKISSDPLWSPATPFAETTPLPSKTFVKLLTLKMKADATDTWFKKQPYWNRAMHDTGGFLGGDILRSVETDREVLLCARWSSKEALDHFMSTGAPVMMEKTGVGSLFAEEIGRNYTLDHRSIDRR